MPFSASAFTATGAFSAREQRDLKTEREKLGVLCRAIVHVRDDKRRFLPRRNLRRIKHDRGGVTVAAVPAPHRQPAIRIVLRMLGEKRTKEGTRTPKNWMLSAAGLPLMKQRSFGLHSRR